jgi:hypothetical protein
MSAAGLERRVVAGLLVAAVAAVLAVDDDVEAELRAISTSRRVTRRRPRMIRWDQVVRDVCIGNARAAGRRWRPA